MHTSSRSRWLLAPGAVLGMLGASERRSDACSCSAPALVSPAPGSTGVPTNLELLLTGGPRNAALVGGGESVNVDLQQLTCGDYRYQAQLDLQPDTTYELQQYDPPRVITSFTTGDGPDDSAPGEATIDELWFGVDTAADHSDCGGRTQVNLAVDAPGATTLVVRRETTLGGCDMIIFPEETGNFGTPYGDDCRVHTTFEAGEEYCWEVRARDLAGNEGPPTRRCAAVLQCASADAQGDLTSCELPSRLGCTVDPGDGRPGAVILLGAALVALVLRRRR